MWKLELIIFVAELNHSLSASLGERIEYVIRFEGFRFDLFKLLLQILIIVHGAVESIRVCLCQRQLSSLDHAIRDFWHFHRFKSTREAAYMCLNLGFTLDLNVGFGNWLDLDLESLLRWT